MAEGRLNWLASPDQVQLAKRIDQSAAQRRMRRDPALLVDLLMSAV